MPIPTTTIRTRLNSVPSNQRDNEAQAIVNGASHADLGTIDADGIYLLLYAMRGRFLASWESARDTAAIELLKTHSQFQYSAYSRSNAVARVKAAPAASGNAPVQSYLTAAMVGRIYAAEGKRMSFVERYIRDGATIGRGQVGQPAFTDILRAAPSGFATAWNSWAEGYYATRRLHDDDVASSIRPAPSHGFVSPTLYSEVYSYAPLEDFVVAAYLALKIVQSTKAGRSAKDAARIGVALYFGARASVVAAQTAVNNTTDWAPVAAHLRANDGADIADYVDEVVL